MKDKKEYREQALKLLPLITECSGCFEGYCSCNGHNQAIDKAVPIVANLLRKNDELETEVKKGMKAWLRAEDLQKKVDELEKGILATEYNVIVPMSFYEEVERNDGLQQELADIKEAHEATMNEVCEGTDDRKHCTCVPFLRAEIEALKQSQGKVLIGRPATAQAQKGEL